AVTKIVFSVLFFQTDEPSAIISEGFHLFYLSVRKCIYLAIPETGFSVYDFFLPFSDNQNRGIFVSDIYNLEILVLSDFLRQKLCIGLFWRLCLFLCGLCRHGGEKQQQGHSKCKKKRCDFFSFHEKTSFANTIDEID